MRAYILAAVSALTAVAQARIRPNGTRGFDCGVNITTADPSFVSAIKNENLNNTAAKSPSQLPALFKRQMYLGTISIPTYIHVLTTNASANSITPFMVAQQVSVMNKAYNPYNIKFRLMKTEYIVNDTWARAADDSANEMKSALRQGTYGSLNLYFHTDLSGGILGTCTLPTDIGYGTPPASLYSVDGCSVAAQTMPGGNIYGYNLGFTAVHEIGHWLGLLQLWR